MRKSTALASSRVQIAEARLDTIARELGEVLGKVAEHRRKAERIPEGQLLALVSGSAMLMSTAARCEELRTRIAEEVGQ